MTTSADHAIARDGAGFDHRLSRTSLRIMSFNLRYATAPDGRHGWPHRRRLVARTIRRFEPDVLGTQECLALQRDYLRQQMPGYDCVGVGRDDGQAGGEMCAIFYRTQRFDRLAEGHFWLSETPDVPGSKSWDSSLPRLATWVRLRDRTCDETFYVLNTHLDVAGPVAREQGARLIRQRARQFEPPPRVVLTGDFNTGPASVPYTVVARGTDGADTPWSDTYSRFCRQADQPPHAHHGTRHDFTGRRDNERIDWIFTSPQFRIMHAGIDTWHDNGRWPSDHYPVTAVLRLADE